MSISRTLRAIFLCALLAVPTVASAQDGFQVEQFEPLPAQGTNILNISKSEPLGHLKPAVGLFLHVADDPLEVVERGSGELDARAVDFQFKGELSAGIGLFDLLDVGLVVPLTLGQRSEPALQFGSPDFQGTDLGDIRLIPRLEILDGGRFEGFGLAVAGVIQLPTGDQETYNSDGGIRGEPRLVVDYSTGFFTVAGNVGVDFRPTNTATNYETDNALRYGVGFSIPVRRPVYIIGSIFGSYGFGESPEPGTDIVEVVENPDGPPLEALGGIQLELPVDLVAQLGGGAGLTNAVGSPDFRFFGSIGYTPRGLDRDNDGIEDAADDCQTEAEDLDGFEDDDGCPDIDNDGDGVLDVSDKCPLEVEDSDTFQDEDGCPDPDNDQDEVLDVDDNCPMVPGDPRTKGCPAEDSDGDGLMDPDDECPRNPEDPDGFEDDDGCPDNDNDKDGIFDKDDKCPLQPEVINGFEDTDGCPDEGEMKVFVTKKKIKILEKIYFEFDKAVIQPRSYSILNQVAAVMKANPQITLVRIEGHTDSEGTDSYNLDLSKRRAASVRAYLEKEGVPSTRLTSEGYGESRPIADNATDAGREQNRRVEFTIMELNGQPVGDAVEEPAGDGGEGSSDSEGDTASEEPKDEPEAE